MKRQSFTLVEVLIVATIIAILSAIGAISYRQFVKQSRDARRKTDLEQIRSAIEIYKSFNNVYPTRDPAFSAGMPFGLTSYSIADGSSTYMSRIPGDPQSGFTYFYDALPAGAPLDYTLCAYIETQSSGGVAGTNCSASGLTLCNYCMGPYGQK